MAEKTKRDLLIHRMSRLIGQLEAVREELHADDPDCKKMSQTLKASSRSFASLRKAFIECVMEEKYLKKQVDSLRNDDEYQALLSVINS